MSEALDYQAFLEAKVCVAQSFGFSVDIRDVNPRLKDHCKVIAPWMCG